MDKAKIFENLKDDYEKAKSAKIEIDKLISDWNNLYYGKVKNNESKKLLMKEVAKMIEYMKPNITEPFLSTSTPIKVSRAGNLASAVEIENYLNGVFAGELDREEFINDLVDILLREGTVWTRSGWVRETSKEEQTVTMTMQEVLGMMNEPKRIKQIDEDLFEVTNDVEIVLKNHPNSRICRNENCFPDPTARQEKELNFFVEKRYVTYYDLVKMGIFSRAKLNTLKARIMSDGGGNSHDKGHLEQERDDEHRATGGDVDKGSSDINRRKIQLIEYWGYYDLEDNGNRKSMVASWINEFDLLLEIEETPMPSKKIPYKRAVYSSRPFSLWGNAVAFFIGESQNVKNGVVRSILDSAALANNGQKFVLRGGVDFVNFQRLKNRDRYVMVNKPDAISDGTFNNIPSSTFNLLDMVNKESSQLVGVDGAPAISSGNIAKDSEQNSMSLSQQKMVSIVRSVSGLMGKNAKEWVQMAEVFLDDEQIIDLFSNDDNPENDRTDINAFRNSRNTLIMLTVGTGVAKQQELQQLNMLMQQAKVLGEQIPAQHLQALVARMYDLFDMTEEANQLRNYKPEPTQEEQMMQQLSMQKVMLEIAELQGKIAKTESETLKNNVTAQTSMIDANSNAQYKGSQTTEKYARAESHQVDTALRPGEFLSMMQEKLQKNKEKG